jgi:hypothetical protein
MPKPFLIACFHHNFLAFLTFLHVITEIM